MAIDMEEIRIFADASDDMLVPDFGQHGAAMCFHVASSLQASGLRRHLPLGYGLMWALYRTLAPGAIKAQQPACRLGFHSHAGYFSMSAKVFAKVWTSPGHLAET